MIGQVNFLENAEKCDDFNQLKEIEVKLDEIRVPVVKASPQEAIQLKENYKENLNEIACILASHPPRDQKAMLLFAKALTKYGRLRYEEDYPICMAWMRASLELQCQALGLYNPCSINFNQFTTLREYESILSRHEQFATFDDFLAHFDPVALLMLLQYKNLSNDVLYHFGFTLSWLANSLHHTKGYRANEEDKTIEAKNRQRFDNIYAFCEKVLKLIDTQEAKLELAEVYYNGFCGLVLRDHPDDLEGAHKYLDKAQELNPTLEMQARVANLKSCHYLGKNIEKALEFLNCAIQIRESFPKEEQDPFLIANMYSRKAGFELKVNQVDAAEDAIKVAIAYSDACRGARNPETDQLIDLTHDHQYFGIYDLKMAEIKLKKGEQQEGLKYINRALETFEHHKNDSGDLIKMAEECKAALHSLADLI